MITKLITKKYEKWHTLFEKMTIFQNCLITGKNNKMMSNCTKMA